MKIDPYFLFLSKFVDCLLATGFSSQVKSLIYRYWLHWIQNTGEDHLNMENNVLRNSFINRNILVDCLG